VAASVRPPGPGARRARRRFVTEGPIPELIPIEFVAIISHGAQSYLCAGTTSSNWFLTTSRASLLSAERPPKIAR